MEKAELPGKVDVIISEWMGGFGVDENLLHPLLQLRDKWLKPGGKMIPEMVTTWMAPCYDQILSTMMDFWHGRPYGIDFGYIGEHTTNELLLARHHIGTDQILARPQPIWAMNAYSYSVEEAAFPFAGEGVCSPTPRNFLKAIGEEQYFL
uniref:PRMT5 arginine-N-methyltransferase n=1 Tax=Candidatus Kentrum sp. TUN TaxID=2126343 RepID=A0A450ZMU7_9GAMM|nr:MAG: PRMT5 arginine-N-methyltransferase [Candidatus Kentron sp. TUN]VFK61216.1 MAG: PRMT5 arginine-N-methyltransferase [Candidatus Kentron sp. TUN]VFK62409.1 MAG: PRMT5 arginine-N-methyltransferase [Candidatus Kentron sp. TUN]